MKRKLPGKNFKNLGIPPEVVLLIRNFGKCRSIRYYIYRTRDLVALFWL